MGDKVNLFIIGQPKSGTTAIYDYLIPHPDIFVPKQKQLYYFATDHNQERKRKKKYNRNYYKNYYNYSFDDYLKNFNFSNSEKYYCDITPDYFYSKTAAKEIFKYNKDAKIILLLRNPLEFLKSFHIQMINSNCEDILDFWEAIFLEKLRKEQLQEFNTTCPQQYYYYNELVDYVKFIKPYYNLFQNNFKIIIYEPFKFDNFKYLNKLFCFLHVDLFNYKSKLISNPSTYPSKSSIENKVLSFYIVRLISSMLPVKLKRILKKVSSKKEIDSSTFYTSNSIKDKSFKKETFLKVQEINKFINDNNLLLEGGKIDLIKLWGYNGI